MRDDISMALIQSIIDSQKDLIAVFCGDKVMLINEAFKNFLNISSQEEYEREYPSFLEHFVPHPSYFNAEKIEPEESWFDTVMKLEDIDRVVSMMTPDFDPYAFSIDIIKSAEDYKIVTLTDITQSLIKRIMIDNRANLDVQSGAYSKNYFLHIAQSYQNAANFNEKIIGAILIKADGDNFSSDEEALGKFSKHFQSITRQDDMLIRWSDNSFLLIYLVDNADNSQQMLKKLDDITSREAIQGFNYTFTLTTQKENETIKELIERIGE